MQARRRKVHRGGERNGATRSGKAGKAGCDADRRREDRPGAAWSGEAGQAWDFLAGPP